MAKKLHFIWNQREFQITPMGKQDQKQSSSLMAPGRGVIEISTPTMESSEVSSGGLITCAVEVKGSQIAQIHSILLAQINREVIGPLLFEFQRSLEERTVNGIHRPRWKTENQSNFQIEPGYYQMRCAESATLVCARPELYGVTAEEQVWNVKGVYQRGGGEPFRAEFSFNHQGEMIRKIGFYPESAKGLVSPFDLLIEEGDTFEPYVSIFAKKGEIKSATSNPIMLDGRSHIRLEWMRALQGIYHTGVAVEDFDGNVVWKYSPVKIF